MMLFYLILLMSSSRSSTTSSSHPCLSIALKPDGVFTSAMIPMPLAMTEAMACAPLMPPRPEDTMT
ncbi:unnamed protein product, partial [Ixodes persulcatus]